MRMLSVQDMRSLLPLLSLCAFLPFSAHSFVSTGTANDTFWRMYNVLSMYIFVHDSIHQQQVVEPICTVCEQLNQYGCNAATIPILVQLWLIDVVPDEEYVPPLNRCDFDTINVSYFGQYTNLSMLYMAPASYLTTIPCEILIQLPHAVPALLDDKNVSYLIDPVYWFSDNGNETDPPYLSCNVSKPIICPIDDSSSGSNQSSVSNSDEPDHCYRGTECLYPFVPSKYLTNYPRESGMCYCNLDCRLTFTKIDRKAFDLMMNTLGILCLLSLSIYSINVFSEFNVFKSFCDRTRRLRRTSSQHLVKPATLSMDIPPIIAVLLFIFLCLYNGPYFTDQRSRFICEDGSEWNNAQHPATPSATAVTMWQANKLCFVFGAMIYFLVILMINYFCLLSLVIYRYVSEPLMPLWGLRKRYFHLTVIMYSAIYLVILVVNEDLSGDLMTGTCGPSFGRRSGVSTLSDSANLLAPGRQVVFGSRSMFMNH